MYNGNMNKKKLGIPALSCNFTKIKRENPETDCNFREYDEFLRLSFPVGRL